MNRRTIAAILAAATIASTAAPAIAQRFFMREKIVGMTIQIAYVPTYSTTYSSCVGGKQSAPIASCARADGTPAAISDCSRSPQTTSKDCQVQRCGTLNPYNFARNNPGGVLMYLRDASTLSDAQSRCEAYAQANPSTSFVCTWQSPSVGVWLNANISSGSATNHATYCG